ncbi:MAG: PEGA domain-containing protein, partial [Steroidobacteraceae bacterium]
MNEVAKKAPAYTQIRVREPAGQRTFEEALAIGGEGAQVVVPGAHAGVALRIERHAGLWVATGDGRFAGGRELRVGDLLTVGDADVIVQDVSRTLLQLEIAHRVGNATIAPMETVASLAAQPEDDEILIRAALGELPPHPASPPSPPLRGGEGRVRGLRGLRTLPLWLAAAALALLGLLVLVAAVEPIALDLRPAGARVRTPGTLVSFRSGDRVLVLPGEHRLRAEARGYLPAEATVAVREGDTARVRLHLAKAPGVLDVDTAGVPATVSVDGVEVGRAPGTVEIAAGPRTITLRAPRHLDFVANVEIRGAGERQDLRATLQPDWGTLRITARHANVRVAIDGRPSGSTPAALEVPAGVRRVQLEADGLKTWQSSLVIKAGETLAIGPIRLGQPDARLAVRSRPAGAEVTVGGAFRGRTPLDLDLSPGISHEVVVSLPGHVNWSRALFAEPGAKLAVDARLAPVLARVAVRGVPEGAELLVDGTARGTTPRVLDLLAVEHRVEVRKEGFLPFTATVVPAKGLERSVEYRLVSSDRATQLAESAPTITTKIGYELRILPPGTFTMGSGRREQGRRPNEGMRQVTLKRPVYLGVTEVTNAQFRKFRSGHASGHIEKRTLDLDNHPVTRVSWDDTAEFCNWVSAQEGLPPAYEQRDGRFALRQPVTNGYRLPTEAEWEHAGRYAGPDTHHRYAWGDALPVPPQIGNLA